jgi:hypothetical protein
MLNRLLSTFFVLTFITLSFAQRAQSIQYPFSLSDEGVKEAIEYGRNAIKTDNFIHTRFGGTELDINKYSLGKGVGYIKIVTPFVKIASSVAHDTRLDRELDYDWINKVIQWVTIDIILFTKKDRLESKVTCIIKIGSKKINLSDQGAWQFSIGPDGGIYERFIGYKMPKKIIDSGQDFNILISNINFGRKEIRIKIRDLK